MKITFIASSLWLSGGARVVVEFANRLSRRGHQLTIVIPKGAISEDLSRDLDVSVKIIEAKIPLTKQMSVVDKIRLVLSMIQEVPKGDVIVATHTPTTVVSLAAGHLLRRGIPVWLYQDYPGMFSDRPIEGWLLRNALRWHKAALVISMYLARELNSFCQGKCYLVSEGLSNTECLYPLPDDRKGELNREKKSIFYLGDFRPRKGLSDFLEAMDLVYQQNQNIELWIAVKEPGEIKTMLPFRYIHRPTVMQLADLYRTCNLFVSASWSEGFGLPPLEAMACGAPVVTTNSGGVLEYASDGENCLLVPPRDPRAMAEAILRVMNNPSLEAQLRRQGPKTASKFNWEKATDRFEKALVEICAAQS